MKVDWSKYPLSQSEWIEFSKLSHSERSKFLKAHNFQYQQGFVPRCVDCNHVFFNCVCDNPEYQKRKAAWKAELSKPFEEKLKHSEDLVREKTKIIIDNKLKIYLGYSGGIDSECCLQLFKEPIKQGIIKVVVGNTLTELPDTYKRWRDAEKELGVQFLYALPARGITLKTNAIKFGLPLYPRNTMVKLGKDLNGRKEAMESSRMPTKRCCANLKEKPQLLITKGFDGNILGLKATEGQGRQWTIKHTGDCYISREGIWHIRPIAWWTTEDEWNFQKLRGFKYNAIYDKTNCGIVGKYKLISGKYLTIRSGCAYCPQGIHGGYLEWLKEYYPKYFDNLEKLYNDVAEVRGDGIDFYKVLAIKKIRNLELIF